jgi:hypothetical protein
LPSYCCGITNYTVECVTGRDDQISITSNILKSPAQNHYWQMESNEEQPRTTTKQVQLDESLLLQSAPCIAVHKLHDGTVYSIDVGWKVPNGHDRVILPNPDEPLSYNGLSHGIPMTLITGKWGKTNAWWATTYSLMENDKQTNVQDHTIATLW